MICYPVCNRCVKIYVAIANLHTDKTAEAFEIHGRSTHKPIAEENIILNRCDTLINCFCYRVDNITNEHESISETQITRRKSLFSYCGGTKKNNCCESNKM